MKTLDSIDAPPKARALHSEQSLRREDFALELAKMSDSRYGDQHAPHTPDLRQERETAHETMPDQKAVTTPPASPASTLVTSNVMKVVPTDHPLLPQATTTQHGLGVGSLQVARVIASRALETTPAIPTDAMTVPTTVATGALPITPVVEQLGLLPTIHTTPATQTAKLGLPPSGWIEANMTTSYGTAGIPPGLAETVPAVETQEGDSQSWLSIQQQLNVMVAPTGVTEDLLGSRVFGVHLLASTYLSELTAREEEGITADSIPGALAVPEAHMPPIVQPITADATSTLTEAATDQASRGEASLILSVIMNEEMAPIADSAHPARASATATSAASTLVWPDSLLRLTKGSDGSTVVWLRDYRLDGEDASRLVSALVQGAQAQGARLGRIVLNGHEVWTSPNNR